MATRFQKISTNAFKELQIGAAMLLTDFDPTTGAYDEDDIFIATSGGITFTATPTHSDFAADIDNAAKNMLEFKRLDSWETITLSGTGITMNTNTARRFIAAADVGGTQIVPRNNLDLSDFFDLWLVGDYSDKNGETNGGFIAIHLMNALSTGGFSLQTADRAKGTFSFTFQAHYSIAEQDTVPFEVYIKEGTDEGGAP